jgi:hypothetical protein
LSLPNHICFQAKLPQQLNSHKTARVKSEAMLAGRIFDDRGTPMTPSHVRKRGIKYRYYLCSVLLQGQPERAGAVGRIPAAEMGAWSCDRFASTSINRLRSATRFSSTSTLPGSKSCRIGW